MDKESVIRLCNKFYGYNTIAPSLNDISVLLTDYCIEHGKDKELTNKFITILINTPFLTNCISDALSYYKKKFNIIELKKGDRTLLIY